MANTVEFIDVESRPVKWLIDNMRDGNIVIDNSFQRRYVWTPKDKVALIETILLGYPIPEIYLWQNDTDPETGDTIFSVVDGQQRLGAVLDFINNNLRLNKSGLENTEAAYAGKMFKDLESDPKSDIWKYKFSIRFIKESISKDQIIKVFLRLNRTSISLNPQELRNAEFNGKFIVLADEISKMPFWEKYKIFNTGDLRRMQDIQFISTLLIFLRKGIEEETTQKSINSVYDQYNENYPEAEEDAGLIQAVLDIIDKVVDSKPESTEIVKKKTHLYTVFLLCYYLKLTQVENYEEISDKLNIWFRNYITENIFNEQTKDRLLMEYRSLSQEGVQKKANRQRRFDILKEYIQL
jgi:hypothetical protein